MEDEVSQEEFLKNRRPQENKKVQAHVVTGDVVQAVPESD